MMSRAEQAKAENDYEGKKRLFDRKFTTSNDLQNAKISLDKAVASVKAAEVARQLFVEYEFSKEAQKLMADYVLARRKLQRTEQQALSKIAQAKAKLLSAEGQFKIESQRIGDYEEQIRNCVMVAERAGLVVYGGSSRRYWDDEPIKEGTTVREKQSIITIPDMSKMAVKVNIHESDIKRIAVGQRASVRVDAFPDRVLHGEVVKVGVLPDAENRWMNPDLKVYETTISIEGTFEWLKPGMSAEAEVLIKRLADTVYIPIQSVVPQGDKQVCFVVDGGKVSPREIETGDITVEYITVAKGLLAGERVLIRPPDGSRREETDESGEQPEEIESPDGVNAPAEAPAIKTDAAPAASETPAAA
jgi:multidrug efflux pump subunit AcrA (membrane-fusion protein)